MSVYYRIFTEVRIKNDWHLIDPQIICLKSNKSELVYTYETSRSWFSETYDKLQCDVNSFCKIKQGDLSKELKEYFDKDSENYRDYYEKEVLNDSELFEKDLFTVKYNEIFQMCHYLDGKELFSYHGFVPKDQLQAFELHDIEYLYPEEIGKYCKLSEEERNKLYVYYEWDNSDDWLYQFKRICKNVEHRVYDFSSINYEYIEGIRLIIYIC